MRFTRTAGLLVAATFAIAAAERTARLTRGPGLQLSQSCETLASLTLPMATITLAQHVPAGEFQSLSNLPAFCRVAATLAPTADSDVHIEVWLPATGWNGKFQAVGNGAWSGAIAYPAMATALRGGYATSSTDTGHTGNNAQFALGHPEKLIDFAYRSEHEMAVAAKAIVRTFYDRAPTYSYWNGCSAGGRQALKEAQMYPADFDGILAGSPGLDWSGRSAQAVRVAHALQNAESRLPPATVQIVHAAAIDACDSLDGLKDGLISDPERCTFDPAGLQCAAGETSGCLTPAQVSTVRLMYAPAIDPKTKREFAGLARGSERGWTDLGWTASARATGLDHFRYVVFKDPAWEIARFDERADLARIDEANAKALNADDPNLKPFFDRGGKLLQYHGWSDPQISPFNSVTYFKRVLAALGGARSVRDSYRLFMAPGMAHCGGGEGPSAFNAMPALEQWVEQKTAPDSLLAAHTTNGRTDRTRPLCPYPQTAIYKGLGSIEDAVNFSCQ